MKNSGLSKKRIIIVLIMVIGIIGGVFLFGNSLKENKSYATNEGIANIAAYVDENDNPTSAYFVLENLNAVDLTNVSYNTFKITSTANIEFFDPETKDAIAATDDIVTMPAKGLGVKVTNLSRGVKYDVTIKPESIKKGYKTDFKKAVIELDYSSTLTARIKSMIDVDNNEININDNDSLLFLYTEDDNKIRMRAREDVDIDYYYSLDRLTDSELNNVNWLAYNKNSYLEVTTNGYLYAKAKYKTSTYSEINMLRITNIDKSDPGITLVSKELTNDNKVKITYTYKDAEETKEYGDSGVNRHAFTNYVNPPANDYQATEDNQTVEQIVTENGIYHVYVKDQAGNLGHLEIDVDDIPEPDLDNCLFIIDSTKNDLIATQYKRLTDMVTAITDAGVTRNDKVVVQLECNISNQQVTLNNMNLTMDLNGYTISSNTTTPVFTVSDTANLTVLDEKYDLGTFFNTIANRDYDYTGNEAIYTAPADGTYKLEVWGAQGGASTANSTSQADGGYGGYAVGEVTLTKNQRLFINVGGQGTNATANQNSNGGYNGGGHGTFSNTNDRAAGGGGGATHIATETGNLQSFYDKQNSLLIVAGGGGGAAWTNQGGAGGGFTGGAGGNTNKPNQENGYAFGKGQDGDDRGDAQGMGGAGGGYYGGYTSEHNNTSGSGGSGYIANSLLTNKQMVCYNCDESSETSTMTISTTSHSNVATALIPKEGNGYVRITGLNINVDTHDIDISEFTHGTGNGQIINSVATAVNINVGGVLQLGKDNSPDNMHVEEPNTESPYLYGKEYAVGSAGLLNFYDGVLVGERALNGNVDDTPFGYDASTTTDDDTHDFIMTVRKLTNVEALIGRTRFTTVEQAIISANNYIGTIDDIVKIDIIKDLEKELTVEIPNDKNIELDLNGHTWVTLASAPVITNYGQTRLSDSVGSGKVYSNKKNVISNENGGRFYLNNALIEGAASSGGKDGAALYNKGGSYFELNEGIIRHLGGTNNVVYNEGGELVINGGEIISSHSWGYTSAIAVVNMDKLQRDSITTTKQVTFEDFRPDPSSYYDGFTTNDDGTMSPVDWNTPYEYDRAIYPIDLSDKTQKDIYKVSVNITGDLNPSAYAFAHALIDDNDYKYGSYTYNRLFYVNTAGEQNYQNSIELTGGRVWYLHLYYYSGYRAEAENPLKIDIKIDNYRPYTGKITMNGGTIYNKNTSISSKNVATGGYDDAYSSFTLNGGVIANQVTNNGIFTQNGGYINDTATTGEFGYWNMNDGYLKSMDNNRGSSRAYGTQKTTGFTMSGGTVDLINSKFNYTHVTGGLINGNITILGEADIANTTINGITRISSILDYETVKFKNTIFNQKQVYIHAPDSIPSAYTFGTSIEFDGCTFNKEMNVTTKNPLHYSHIIRNYNQDLIIKNSTINFKATDNYADARTSEHNLYTALNNNSIGNVYFDNTKINIEVNPDNKLVGYAIASYTSVNGRPVDVGDYSISNSSLYHASDDEVLSTNYVFGTKDGNYQRDSFVINSNSYGIYLTANTYSFFDGHIKTKQEPYEGAFKEVETGFAVNKYTEDGYNYIDLSDSIKNIYYVEGDKYFASFDGSMKYLEDNNITSATLRFLGENNYISKSDYSVIKSDLSLTIDLNGKATFINDIVNNGNLTFIDNTETPGTVLVDTLINNNTLSINGGSWTYNVSADFSIQNNGILNYSNSSHHVEHQYGEVTKSHWMEYLSDSVFFDENKIIIDNNGTVNIGNGYVYNTTDDSNTLSVVYNHPEGTVNVSGGTVNISKKVRFIDNYGGVVNVTGGEFNNTSESNVGLPIRSIPQWKPETVLFSTKNSWVDYNQYKFESNTYHIAGEYAIPMSTLDMDGDVKVEIEYAIVTPSITNDVTGPMNFTNFKMTNRIYDTIGASSTHLGTWDNYRATYIMSIPANTSYQFLHIYLPSRIIITGLKYYNDTKTVELIHQPSVNITGGSFKNKAVETIGGDLNIDGATFTGANTITSYGNSNVDIKNVAGVPGFVRIGYGGSVVNIEDSSLRLNTAYALSSNASNSDYGPHAGFFSLKNVTFTSGTDQGGWNAINVGSGLYMENCTMNLNGASSINAIKLNGGNVVIKDTTININGQRTVNGISVSGRATDCSAESITCDGIFNTNLTLINTSINATGIDGVVGITTDSNKNVVTIGENDDDVSITSPSIAGTQYGLSVGGGYLNFYDGILKGQTEVFTGTITDKPDGYDLKYGTEEAYKTAILYSEPVVNNTDTNVGYSSLQSALNACTDNITCNLELLKTINLTNDVTVPTYKIVNLNLGTYTISGSTTGLITNNGVLTVTSGTIDISAGSGLVLITNNGTLNVGSGATITNYSLTGIKLISNTVGSTLNITGGTITTDRKPGSSFETIVENNGGTINLNSGSVVGTHSHWNSSANGKLFLITTSNSDSTRGTVNITGGTIRGTAYVNAVRVINSDIHMSDGSIISTDVGGVGIRAEGSTTIEFTGGTITNEKESMILTGGSRLYGEPTGATGGTITSTASDGIGINVSSGSIDISKLSISLSNNYNQRGIYSENINPGVTFKFKDSNITVHGTTKPKGITFKSGVSVDLDNSTIDVTGTSDTYGIFAATPPGNDIISVININDSTVSAISTTVNDGTAIYHYSAKSFFDITIGKKDNTYNSESTLIKGSNYAIYTNGYDIKMYDGKLQGKELHYTGISEFEDGYTFNVTTSDGIKTGSLVPITNAFENVDTHNTYNYLNEAFIECGTSECNLKQLRDYYINKEETVALGQNIILDMDTHNIYANTGDHIVNNGTFTMKNGNGYIEGSMKKQSIINNNGTLNMNNDLYMSTNKLMQVSFIKNSKDGTVNLNGGTYEFYRDHSSYNNHTHSTGYSTGSKDIMNGYVVDNLGGIVNVNAGVTFNSYVKKSDGTLTDGQLAYTGILNRNAFLGDVIEYENNPNTVESIGYINSNFVTGGYYIPLDLTEFTGDTTIEIRNVMATWDGKTYVYMKVTDSTTAPDFVNDYDNAELGIGYPRIVKVTKQGGRMYYLHVSGSYNSHVISSIKIYNDSKTVDYFKKAVATINNGTFNGAGYIVSNLNGEMYFKNGIYNSNIYNHDGKIEITGGTLKNHKLSQSTQYTEMYMDDLTVIVDADSATFPTGYISYAGSTVIDGLDATITKPIGAFISDTLEVSDGSMTINNMKIDAKGQKSFKAIEYESYNSYPDDDWKLVINNCDISIESAATSNSVYAIYGSGEIYMYNGVINITGNYGTGIAGSKVTLGTNDAYVLDTYPVVTAPVNAIYNNGYSNSGLKFYDGVLTSNSSGEPINGTISDLPDDYRVVVTTTDDKKIAKLKKNSQFEDTFQYNGVYYETLDMAIAQVESDGGTGTIKIWNDVQLAESVTIPSGTNITIMLEGHTLEFSNVEYGIINNGTLTIIDGESPDIDANTESQIKNVTATAIQNNGTLIIGTTNNPNPQSPKIIGNVAISGTAATVRSGTITSTGNTGLSRYNNGLINPSYSYKYSNLQVSKVPDTVPLAVKPAIRSVDDLTVWTNQNIQVGLTSHNYGVLNVFTKVDENQKKNLKYTVEIYKNNSLDEFESFDYVVEVQYLHDNYLDVDLDYFDGIETKYKGYKLSKMTINDTETNELPEKVEDGTVFRLFYNQNPPDCVGDECVKGIEIVNPKTGRKSYKSAFIIALIAVLSVALGIALYKKLKIEEKY